MSGKNSAGKPPSCELVMRRHAQVTGDPNTVSPSVEGYKSWYGLGGLYMDTISVMQLDGVRIIQTPVGRYNPGERRWQFYPELIKPDEQQALARLAKRTESGRLEQLRASAIELGSSVVDLFHPQTQ